jgi:general secretion pathway protein B
MSILLQALKKSESQRELGSVPNLQTATEPLLSSGHETPGWVPALLVLVAGLLVTWFGLQQYRLPESFQESVAEQRLEQPESTPAPLPRDAAGNQTQAGDSSPASQVNSRPQAGGRGSILPRLAESTEPTETDAGEPEAQEPQQQLGRQVRDYAAEQEASQARYNTSTPPTRDNAVRQPELAKVEVARPEVTAGQASATRPEPGITGDSAFEPEMISYWQVPEKMREGLPELRISVLVFAEQPEDRFLLLNGERLREGEQTSGGLLLEEIRRDRAIFNYRNYRFYLKS